jgi:hypothetical protein
MRIVGEVISTLRDGRLNVPVSIARVPEVKVSGYEKERTALLRVAALSFPTIASLC